MMWGIGGYRFDIERHDELVAGEMPLSAYTAAMGAPHEAPRSFDPRAFSPVRNQSSEGSCQGHSITAALGLCHYAKTGTWKDFNPDHAYYRSQALDGLRGDVGSTIAGGMRYANTIGGLPQDEGPAYTPKYNPGDYPQSLDVKCQPYRIYSYTTLRTYDDIVKWIGNGFGGVSWGIRWGLEPDSKGDIRRYRSGSGGHATALLGYGDDFLWLKNSWGTTWGLSGWARIYREAIEGALRDSYTVVVGISDMAEVKPRDIDWVKESINA